MLGVQNSRRQFGRVVKALDLGSSSQERGFESHSCHFLNNFNLNFQDKIFKGKIFHVLRGVSCLTSRRQLGRVVKATDSRSVSS